MSLRTIKRTISRWRKSILVRSLVDVEQDGVIKESDPVDILVSTRVQVKQSDGSYKQTDDSIVLGAEVRVQFVTKSPVSCFIPFRLTQFQT